VVEEEAMAAERTLISTATTLAPAVAPGLVAALPAAAGPPPAIWASSRRHLPLLTQVEGDDS